MQAMEDEFLEYASKKKDLFWSIFFFFLNQCWLDWYTLVI